MCLPAPGLVLVIAMHIRAPVVVLTMVVCVAQPAVVLVVKVHESASGDHATASATPRVCPSCATTRQRLQGMALAAAEQANRSTRGLQELEARVATAEARSGSLAATATEALGNADRILQWLAEEGAGRLARVDSVCAPLEAAASNLAAGALEAACRAADTSQRPPVPTAVPPQPSASPPAASSPKKSVGENGQGEAVGVAVFASDLSPPHHEQSSLSLKDAPAPAHPGRGSLGQGEDPPSPLQRSGVLS